MRTSILYVINLNPEGITKSYILKLQDGAHRLAINEKQNLIYVLNIWSRSVVSIDGRTNSISEPVYLQGAYDMLIDPETSMICILGENVISEIDMATGKLICSSEELYIVSHTKMAFDFSRNTAYLTNIINKSVDVIDLKAGKMIGCIPLGKKPLDIRIDQECKIIYVGTDSPATLIIIDVNTNSIIKEIDLHVKKSIWRLLLNSVTLKRYTIFIPLEDCMFCTNNHFLFLKVASVVELNIKMAY